MRRSAAAALAVVALVLAAPLVLREASPANHQHAIRLVIVTPHGEAIRSEFTAAFTAWMRRERQREIELDWRTPGGTSDITRFLDSRFQAAFRRAHPDIGGRLSGSTPDDAAAKQAFLATPPSGDGSIGIEHDVLFGGGEFFFRTQAQRGYLVDAGLLGQEPTWFGAEAIPQQLSGETVWDAQGRYFSACFSLFGIASSVDRLAESGLPQPVQWMDLGEPAWLGRLTLADPGKSGAAATAFERILQQQLALHADDLERGWAEGFLLIRRMVANAAWITDSASKPPRDAARGDAVAAMAIDFQAKAEADFARSESGGIDRVRFHAPVGGTSVSGDPIGILRGAPQPELARDFVRFVLSVDGQRLWNQRLGTPGGPQRYELRRIPVRRELLGPDQRELRCDPDDDPYAVAQNFTYRPEWTGRHFLLIQALIKAVAIDARDELVPAWTAIIRAGGPQRVPEAWRAFTWMPVGFEERDAVRQRWEADKIAQQRQWLRDAMAQYRRAEVLALEGR